MNNKKSLICAVAASVVMTCFSFTTKAQGVAESVEFGTKNGGSECVGDGVCNLHPPGTSGATNVNFNVSADNSILILTFSLSELQSNQPQQAQFFQSGSYVFSANYALNDPSLSSLGLPSGAQITTSSNSTVTIEGDVVTDYITISYGD